MSWQHKLPLWSEKPNAELCLVKARISTESLYRGGRERFDSWGYQGKKGTEVLSSESNACELKARPEALSSGLNVNLGQDPRLSPRGRIWAWGKARGFFLGVKYEPTDIPVVTELICYDTNCYSQDRYFAEFENMISTCKTKLLWNKLEIPRQKSNKKEHENLTWFGPNLA